jgi:UDP-3-O-[3-hydroxymyristoyl] glucosamine N-acyltransferase
VQQVTGGELHGSPDTPILGIAGLEEAGPDDLTYVTDDRHVKAALSSKAGAFVTARRIAELARPQLVVPHPAHAFAVIAGRFFVAPYKPRGIAQEISRGQDVTIGQDVSIWPFVTLGDRATIGSRVTLYPGVFVGADSAIGDDSVLHPNVVVQEGCTIGARVIIHSGTVIGSDGFGYVQHQGKHQKIPQLGGVTIEDDVELGANVTVDRATFGRTIVRRGTKVDNLVQIAHNVTVGEDNIVVAQVGIAGSTVVGRHVMIGGQAGLADHLRIGDNVMIAARSGVTRDIEGDQVVSGAPAIPHEVWLRVQALIPKLPELRQQVRQLEARLRTLEQRQQGRGGRTSTPAGTRSKEHDPPT